MISAIKTYFLNEREEELGKWGRLRMISILPK